MRLPSNLRLVEVAPRDGLQAEARTLPTETKLAFIDRLAQAGHTVIEATSFVSPKAVPQLADAEELLRALKRRPGVRYPVLVPNERGLERALTVGVTEIAVFAARLPLHGHRRSLGRPDLARGRRRLVPTSPGHGLRRAVTRRHERRGRAR